MKYTAGPQEFLSSLRFFYCVLSGVFQRSWLRKTHEVCSGPKPLQLSQVLQKVLQHVATFFRISFLYRLVHPVLFTAKPGRENPRETLHHLFTQLERSERSKKYVHILHCIALHCIALYCIPFHYITLRCITLRCIALHSITLHCVALHCIPLHYITLHYIAFHCIALQCITLH